MNSEVQVGPPLPQPINAGVVMFIVFLAIVAALVLHYFLKNKGPLMTDHTDDSILDPPTSPERSLEKAETHRIVRPPAMQEGAAATTILAAPAESSVNDVHILRAQDQSLMQLAVQYQDMATPPWSYEALQELPDLAAGGSAIGRRTQVLAAMMTPPCAAGSQRGTSARETLWFLNFGTNKVSAASDKECKALHKKLTDEYYATIAPHRKATLQEIVALTAQKGPFEAKVRHIARCGQTRVAFDTQEEAEGMAERLNTLYAAAIQSELDRVLEEIRVEASA